MTLKRLGVVVLAASLLTAGCAQAEPADVNYLDAAQAEKAVARLVDEANSDRVLEVQLGSEFATVKVVKGDQQRTQTMRAGYKPERLSPSSLPPNPYIKARDLDIAKHVRPLTQYDIVNGCNVPSIRVEVATTRFGATRTHYACLDDARHVWLDPDLRQYQFVDLHNAEGIDRTLTDLRRVTDGRPIYNLALLYGRGGQVDVELAGKCGNLVDCPAVVASRKTIVQEDAPLAFTDAPARLNYAKPIDLSLFSGSSLEAALRKALTSKNKDFWGEFTVTAYQLEGKPPVLEFQYGRDVFYTDLKGDPVHP